MIRIENLSKEFKIYEKQEGFSGAVKGLFSTKYSIKKAVDEVSFSIDAGEKVGYIGVNGAGKSTTIKMMTGILKPTGGTCEVFGLDPFRSRRNYVKNIGVVFGQRSQLWWDLPVSESFGILQRIYDIPMERYRENLAFCKELLELDEFYLTPVRNLSLGQKMRADFAAALLHDPKVLFLDEPTIGLDIVVKERIRGAISDINAARKTTVILTTHDLQDIQEVCKRIIVIDEGKILFDGSLDALQQNFGKWRSVHFELDQLLEERIDTSVEDIFSADTPGLEVQGDESGLLVKFERNSHKVADLINRVMQKRKVRDIRINEPQMQDIVKAIYTKS
ncbi:ABC transporter ATP-binding protein [Spirochaeta dissipatitropha]